MAVYRIQRRLYGELVDGAAKGATIGAGIGAVAIPGMVAGLSKTEIGKKSFKAMGIPKLQAKHYLRAAGNGALKVGAIGAGVGLLGAALSSKKKRK